jgi:hypothetical protein
MRPKIKFLSYNDNKYIIIMIINNIKSLFDCKNFSFQTITNL